MVLYQFLSVYVIVFCSCAYFNFTRSLTTGANTALTNNEGETALDTAKAEGYTDIVHILTGGNVHLFTFSLCHL